MSRVEKAIRKPSVASPEARDGYRRAGLRGTKKLAQALLFAAILLAVGRYAWQHRTQLWNVPKPELPWMSLAAAAGVAAFFIYSACFQRILYGFGIRAAYGPCVGAACISVLGKYLPGKLWSLLIATHLLRRQVTDSVVAAASVYWTTATGVAAMALLGLAGVLQTLSPSRHSVLALLLILALAIPVALLGDGLLRAVVSRCRRYGDWPTPPARHVFVAFLLQLAFMASYGLGFACLVRSCFHTSLSQFPFLIGLFSAAQVTGLLAVFAPAGIGVREGILIVGLQPLIGAGNAIVIAGVTRFWQTGLELVMAGVGSCFLARSKFHAAVR